MNDLKEAIEAAATDMSFEHDGINTPGVILIRFLAAHDLEIVQKQPTLGSHAADLRALRGEQDHNTRLREMLRNMIAAPVFWRSKAQAMLKRMTAPHEESATTASVESQNPAPPESES